MTGLKPFDRFLIKYCTNPGRLLDVGASGQIVDTTVTFMGHKYESLNIGFGNYDVTKDPYHWTMIPDNTYDYTISLTAFEHIEFPWLTFLEMVRVTKNNGLIYIVAPSIGDIHPNTLDCWRYLPDGMRAFAKWGNVTVVDIILDQENAWHYCEGIFKKER